MNTICLRHNSDDRSENVATITSVTASISDRNEGGMDTQITTHAQITTLASRPRLKLVTRRFGASVKHDIFVDGRLTQRYSRRAQAENHLAGIPVLIEGWRDAGGGRVDSGWRLWVGAESTFFLDRREAAREMRRLKAEAQKTVKEATL